MRLWTLGQPVDDSTVGLNDSGLGQARNSAWGSPNTIEAHSQSFGIGHRVLEVLGAETGVFDTPKQQNRWEFCVIFEKHVCRHPSRPENVLDAISALLGSPNTCFSKITQNSQRLCCFEV